MTRWLLIAVGVLAVVAVALFGAARWFLATVDEREPSRVAFGEQCARCHGAELDGTPLAPALVDRALTHGDTTPALIASIAAGVPERGMPAFGDTLPSELVKGLALYISERRQGFPTTSTSHGLTLPEVPVVTRHHALRVEPVARFATLPYSIAPLPDGRVLVTEKIRGLSIVDADGVQSPLIEATPRVWDPLAEVDGAYVGLGMLFDVALHPDYADNGWIYLSHTDRCQLDCGSLVPVSMVRVVRGRIRDGRWVDEEVIWSVDHAHYNVVPDRVSAARLAFDGAGHVFLTVGGKAPYSLLHVIDAPTGKIHRVRDDGRVPTDNPFWQPEGVRPPDSTRHTVWSIGHRTAQGLATHPRSGELWSTEMGPRGGDEVNRIVGGGNYGWPLYTNGLDYDGTPITIGEDLGLDFPIEDTVLPVVDFTPAPALSSFTFHEGAVFSAWENDLLVGSLKAQTLYRLRIADGELIEQEKLLTGLARIRDVEMGADGFVYLLLEDGASGALVRLVPATTSERAEAGS